MLNKQYSKNTSGNNQTINKLTDNNDLIEQLKAAILGECYITDMSNNKDGCLKFTVRGGQLAINHKTLERELSPEMLESKDTRLMSKPVVGMTRKGLKTLLMILDAVLRDEEPIDHAMVFIYYSVEENGEFASGKLVVDRGIHHARY